MEWRKVSVILPTIEEKAAFGVIDRIKKLMPGSEIIVVDKSSEDYKKKIRAKGVTLVSQRSKGYESALMEGFASAHGTLLATIDPDGTYEPEDLRKVVETMVNDGADVGLGNRLHGKNKKVMDSYISFGNKNLAGIYNTLHKAKLHDVMPGIFAMRRQVFEAIKNVEPYRAGTLFFIMEASKKGYNKMIDVPISYHERPEGTDSKLAKSKVVYGMGVAGHIIRSARDYSPLLIFGVIGVLLILAGLVVGTMVLLNYFATGTLSEVGRALIAFMLVTLGFLSIIAGLIIDLLLQIARKMDKL